jgi:RNA polymerase sigma-70 factor (ECF subfamily)
MLRARRPACFQTTGVCRPAQAIPYTAALTLREFSFIAAQPHMVMDFAAQVQALRPQLLRFARSQLRNDAWAEDAVSDTLLAALEKPQSFGGQSQLKTWLVGILKHKVVDQLRRHQREATVLTAEDGEDLDELLFQHDGHWREAPREWGDPEAACGQRQFFEVLEACMEHLPPAQGRVFMMREWLELDTDEICKELTITTTNLWVLLHRARLRLRECLQAGWFDRQRA